MKSMSKFKIHLASIALVMFFVVIGLAWGQTINIFRYGISAPKWYGTTNAGRASSYYLNAPNLTANDTAVGELTSQTLTNKSFTTPVIASFYMDAGKTKLMTAPNTASDTLVTLNATQSFTGKSADVLPLSTPRLTAANGTGITVSDPGSLRTQVYKITLDKTNFVTNNVSHDVIIASMPAKTVIHSAIAQIGPAFACTGVCTSSTLSGTLGLTAGGTEFLASFDMDAAANAVFGDANAEVGSATNAAAWTNGGYTSSFLAASNIVFRGTSGTGAWGNASTTNLSAGNVTFYVFYSVLP